MSTHVRSSIIYTISLRLEGTLYLSQINIPKYIPYKIYIQNLIFFWKKKALFKNEKHKSDLHFFAILEKETTVK